MEQQIKLEMAAIGDMLDTAIAFEFELEVIYYALLQMKKNPELTPVEAFALGVSQWV